MSVRSKTITSSRNWRKIPNPNRFRSSIHTESMEFVSALRDSMMNLHHWALSSAIPASDSSQKQRTLMWSQRHVWEEEGKKFKDSEPVKKKKKKELPVYSRIRTKNQWNRIRNSESLKILAQISDWNPGKHENFILTHSKTITNPRTM